MQVRLKPGIDAPVVRVSAGSTYAREFRKAESPWELRALAAEWAGPPPGLSPELWKWPFEIHDLAFDISEEVVKEYEARLADHERRLRAILEGTGLFEIESEPGA